MWEWDHKESWAPKNWCFLTVVLEKTLESPLDCKEIKPVNPKGKSTWDIHWKDWCWSWRSNILTTWCEEPTHWKRPWCWQRLRAGDGDREGEKVGWHHQINGHKSEQTPGDSEGQGSLVCCNPLGHKESNTTQRLNSDSNILKMKTQTQMTMWLVQCHRVNNHL